MAKFAPDAFLDAGLDYAAGSNYMCICSGSPTTYADAYVNNLLAKIACTSGCFVKADDTSGRKLTVAARTDISITGTGTAAAIALVGTGDTTLRYVTICDEQVLTAGGTVQTNAWKINIQDPT